MAKVLLMVLLGGVLLVVPGCGNGETTEREDNPMDRPPPIRIRFFNKSNKKVHAKKKASASFTIVHSSKPATNSQFGDDEDSIPSAFDVASYSGSGPGTYAEASFVRPSSAWFVGVQIPIDDYRTVRIDLAIDVDGVGTFTLSLGPLSSDPAKKEDFQDSMVDVTIVQSGKDYTVSARAPYVDQHAAHATHFREDSKTIRLP